MTYTVIAPKEGLASLLGNEDRDLGLLAHAVIAIGVGSGGNPGHDRVSPLVPFSAVNLLRRLRAVDSRIVDRLGGNHRRLRGLGKWLLAVSSLVVVASCTTTVHGRGSPKFGNAPSTSRHAASSLAFPSTCVPHAIRPEGAPFCYRLPAGYADYSTRSDYALGWTYRSEVAIGQGDLITVAAIDMHQDSDRLSRHALLRTWVGNQRMIVGSLGAVTAASDMTTLFIDGARAWVQDVAERSGPQLASVRVFTVVRGRTLLSIHCQYLPGHASVLTACQSVVGDIQLVSL